MNCLNHKVLKPTLMILLFVFFALPILAGENFSQKTFSRPSFTLFSPQDTDRSPGLIIFYPGGRVEHQAYFWIGKALAERGYLVAVVDFPLDLAVLAPNRARRVQEILLQDGWNWEGEPIIGGHSLGGAMAARFADNNTVGGLFLWAAYPPSWTNLTEADFPVLVLMAENDGLATIEDVKKGITQLPDHTKSYLIKGGIHSYFGRYGPQRGDGEAEITREEQEGEIFQLMLGFLEEEL